MPLQLLLWSRSISMLDKLLNEFSQHPVGTFFRSSLQHGYISRRQGSRMLPHRKARLPWCWCPAYVTRVLVQQCGHSDALKPDLGKSPHKHFYDYILQIICILLFPPPAARIHRKWLNKQILTRKKPSPYWRTVQNSDTLLLQITQPESIPCHPVPGGQLLGPSPIEEPGKRKAQAQVG